MIHQNSKAKKKSRTDLVRDVFLRRPSFWVPAPDIATAGGLQWQVRVHELRAEGMAIENKMERRKNGTVISYYMWTPAGSTRPLFGPGGAI